MGIVAVYNRPRAKPTGTHHRIERHWIEAVKARSRVKGHLAEQWHPIDLVHVDPDEIEANTQCLGGFDQRRE